VGPGVGGRQAADLLLLRPVHAMMGTDFEIAELVKADYGFAACFRFPIEIVEPSFF
jgi:hypothetical protein